MTQVEQKSDRQRRISIRSVVVFFLLLGIPFFTYSVFRYGVPKKQTFQMLLEEVKSKSAQDISTKRTIEAMVFVDAEHRIQQEGNSVIFWAIDSDQTIFRVVADNIALHQISPGIKLQLGGHIHTDSPPYFHATEVIIMERQ